jgi:hypothetical protein
LTNSVAKVCRLGSFKFPRAVGVPIEKTRGDHPNYSSLNERPPQPRYDSSDQHFLITAGFVPIFVTLHFPTFATISTHSGSAASGRNDTAAPFDLAITHATKSECDLNTTVKGPDQ